MSAPSIFVPVDVSRRAEVLISGGTGQKIREGVELLLQNDIPETDVRFAGPKSDAGSLLQKGLGMLASSPYDALDLAVGAQTIDVRKAYRKMALKYHPGN
jgi:hypothetical protein